MTGSISGLPVVLVTFACSGSGRPSEQPVAAGASKVARIVCDAGGSTAVPAPDVLAQPDGVHVKVGHLDEPASVSVRRIGWDVDPGLSRSVAEILPVGPWRHAGRSASKGVVVSRDGRRIASVGFSFEDGRWIQAGGYVCGGAAVTA